jgi:two-component system, sensor histidine kinase LadS
MRVLITFLTLLISFPSWAQGQACQVSTANLPIIVKGCEVVDGEGEAVLELASESHSPEAFNFSTRNRKGILTEVARFEAGVAEGVFQMVDGPIHLEPESSVEIQLPLPEGAPAEIAIEPSERSAGFAEAKGVQALVSFALGALFLLVTINLLLFVSTRQKDFAYASAYMFAVFVFFLGQFDLFAGVVDDFPLAGAKLYDPILLLILASFGAYTKSFLMIGRFEPLCDTMLKLSVLTCAVSAIAVFLQPSYMPAMYAASLVSLIISALPSLLVKVKEGYANSYLYAPVVALLGAALYLEGDPLGDDSTWILSSGLIVFLLFLTQSFVIAFEVVLRFSAMYRQILNYKSALEKAVEKRTDELSQMAKNLKEANVSLKEASRKDPLTGLSNRRHFDELSEMILKENTRNETFVSLMVIDADHFKSINDTYGHDIGDRTLVTISEIMKSCVRRPMDIVSRFGGEEFVIMLSGTELDGALFVAEKVQQGLRATSISDGKGGCFYLTVSIGLVTLIPSEKTVGGDLFTMADKLVYEAKSNGRDCVCFEMLETGVKGTRRLNKDMRFAQS